VVSGAHKAWQIGGFRIQTKTRVRVEIGEPISTEQWSRKRVDEHVREVEAVFAEKLPEDQRPERLGTAA
jgi:1-acyl-sn-glycerol-3-phosphate acyltransferase